MGVLKSPVFTMCDPQTQTTLENCATGTPNEMVSHFAVGGAKSRGEHIRCVQDALMRVRANNPSFGIPEIKVDGVYGPNSAAAMLIYKRKRDVRNYAGQVDNIVGTGTMRALDDDCCWNVPEAPMPVPPSPPVDRHPQPPPPPLEPVPGWGPLPMPPLSPNPGGPSPGPGMKLIQGGTWTGGATLGVKGGAHMVFILKNLNLFQGTTIIIQSDRRETKSSVLLPGGEVKMDFADFGTEPMGWSFNVRSESDVFMVGWKLFSSWAEGDPAQLTEGAGDN